MFHHHCTVKVQAEIDRVIGQSRQPSMGDRANMPYTDAVIHEVQRMGNIAPLGLPHITNKDLKLGGYIIPKVVSWASAVKENVVFVSHIMLHIYCINCLQGVMIIPNLASALFDKNEWETPDTFNPGHFLNEEGKFVKRAAFVPFSAGEKQHS